MKDAFYFSHDSNARNDIKIIELRSLHGYEGYGIFWAVIEVLRDQSDWCIRYDKLSMLSIAIGVDMHKLKPIIDDMIEIGLLVNNEGNLNSESLTNRMVKYEEIRLKNVANGRKGGRPPKTQKKPSGYENDNPNINPKKSNKERKKERKENTSSSSILNKSKDELVQAELLANHLFETIIKWDPTHRYNRQKPSIKTWVKDFERAIRIDGRRFDSLNKMITYLFTNNSKIAQFWAPNSQSGKKIRDNYDTIKAQVSNERKTASTTQPVESGGRVHDGGYMTLGGNDD